ncbi:MAG: hypothetical protein NC254_06375 [bacterium]|nr:hypothetical protein [bacterium]
MSALQGTDKDASRDGCGTGFGTADSIKDVCGERKDRKVRTGGAANTGFSGSVFRRSDGWN